METKTTPPGAPSHHGRSRREETLPSEKSSSLGFLGVGWIGGNRLEAIAHGGVAEIAAVAGASREQTLQAARISSEAAVLRSLDDLLEVGVDGVVIATPSALHAEKAVAALERGVLVFCWMLVVGCWLFSLTPFQSHAHRF